MACDRMGRSGPGRMTLTPGVTAFDVIRGGVEAMGSMQVPV